MNQKIKIASWNVNSVKARLASLLLWIDKSKPDVILLQEIKCLEGDFPSEVLLNLGYKYLAINGQKTYNGVAIISRYPLSEVSKELPFYDIEEFDEQARYIEAIIELENHLIRVASIYVPNGNSELDYKQKLEQSEKFLYKMRFFDRLYKKMFELAKFDQPMILGGDYNVALEDIDVYDPKKLEGSICFHPDEQKKMRSLLNLGYTDLFRISNPESKAFTWWDYRGNSWNYNHGLRIDYLLASPLACDKISMVDIENFTMDHEKPSDHCPVICELEF